MYIENILFSQNFNQRKDFSTLRGIGPSGPPIKAIIHRPDRGNYIVRRVSLSNHKFMSKLETNPPKRRWDNLTGYNTFSCFDFPLICALLIAPKSRAMPRPKRTKLALTTSAAQMRVANSKQKNPRQLELSSTASSDRVRGNGDDSGGMVTSRNIKANGRGRVATQEITMSGALAPGDPAPARPKPIRGRKKPLRARTGRDFDHDKAIEALKARRDAALAFEKGEPVPADSTLAEKSPLRGRATVRAEEKLPPADDSAGRIVQATPRRAPSVLEASKFKRRPRQPSLLRQIQAQTNLQSEDDEEDLDDFQPHDESTPFLQPRAQSDLYISSSPPIVQSAQSSSSRKRKYTSPDVHVPMSQPVGTVLASSPSRSLTPAPESDEQEKVHSTPSLNSNPNPEPSLPFLPRQPTDSSFPAPDGDTLAPPLSSSPVPSPRPKTAKSKIIRRNSPSSPSPPPSLQPAASRAPKPLSTASLQNLLPRRRLRLNPSHHDEAFDLPDNSDLEIDMSGLGEDEDELNVHANVRVKGRHRNPRPDTGAWATGKGKRKKKPQSPRKDKQKDNTTSRKTYSHQKAQATVASDDDHENENPEEEDDDSNLALASTTRAKAGRGGAKPGQNNTTTSELKRLANKFREVDEWKLDIEDVTGSGSSQKDAR